ncbi:MAG: hypothetical protein QN141_05510 [Armatimonadota bacterium]|nr:hypothetical protein [Armatimonadota bacterium]MDR7452380.1 hypothetical protein [Armatimonadota bacterium]MDR7466725.1 hypothetical protein [Armatimonadota bacterium]MDR7492801.1 hypothetical protein [Armatimonadota bacterium]MDR7498577.1 hypothetical protein [Armatimonadota bacterium]
MSTFGRAALWIVIAAVLAVLVRQHLGYLRGTRPLSFGSFMETGGWLIFLLVAAAAAFGGLADPRTRTVEIAASAVAVVFVVVGSALR